MYTSVAELLGKYLKRGSWNLDDSGHVCRARIEPGTLSNSLKDVSAALKNSFQDAGQTRVLDLIAARNNSCKIVKVGTDYIPCKYGGCQPPTFSDPARNAILSTEI